MTASSKLELLASVSALVAGGVTECAACASAGVTVATLARWRRALAAEGPAGLEDKRSGKSGRRPVARHLTPLAREHLIKLAMGCGSQASALDEFLTSDLCPDVLRAALDGRASRHHIPVSLRRAMTATPEMQAMWNGPKQFQQTAFIQRRDMSMIDLATGARVPIEPGDWWELDDQSTNQPFWFELPAGETQTRQGTADRLAERFGVALGRQGLWAVDVSSGRWLSCELIGRPRDAYRAEDILRFLRRLFEDFGLPRCGLRLERGVWKSRALTGQVIEMAEDQRRIVVDSLRNLGIHIEYCYQSRGKPFVEGGFDHLQTRMAIEAMKRGFKDIGRFRGEKERETAAMLRCKAGVQHPREAGFPNIADLAVAYQDGMAFLNGHAKEGRLQIGVPQELFQAAVEARPLRELAPQHAGLFMPVKFDTCLKGGHVGKTIDGVAFYFGAPEIAARLGNGYRVMACFDPGDPARGCELYNLEIGSRNTEKLAPGQHIGCAEMSAEQPQFGLGDIETREQRKRYSRAFRSAYAACGLAGAGGRRIHERRDGRGGVMRMERDGAEPRQVAAERRTAERTDAELAELDRQGQDAMKALAEMAFAG